MGGWTDRRMKTIDRPFGQSADVPSGDLPIRQSGDPPI
jgi:hypothetical protein